MCACRKACARHGFLERGIRRRRPERRTSSRPQRRVNQPQTAVVIEPCITSGGQRDRSVVDIEDDAVECAGAGANRLHDILVQNRDTRVRHRRAGERICGIPVPFNDRGENLRRHNNRVRPKTGQRRLQSEAEAKATHKHSRASPCLQVRTGQPCDFFFGCVPARRHEPGGADPNTVRAIVFVERDNRAVRSRGLLQQVPLLQFRPSLETSGSPADKPAARCPGKGGPYRLRSTENRPRSGACCPHGRWSRD
jgi:hypothetical protein